jgi:hypothetical protein
MIKRIASFLKKGSKKLLFDWYSARTPMFGAEPIYQSFFASFCSQKEDSSYCLNAPLISDGP